MARSIEKILRMIEAEHSTDAHILALKTALLHIPVPDKLDLIRKEDQWSTIDELAECYLYNVPNFTLVKRAGGGAFGIVYKGLGSEGYRAIKILTWPKLGKSSNIDTAYTVYGEGGLFEKEKIADAFRHQNIIRYYSTGILEDGTRYLIFEWIEGKTLEETGVLSVEQADEIFPQILSAVQHMHAHKYLHNDLRRPNILIDLQESSNRVTLFDYTIATKHFLGYSTQRLSLSSRELLPPEIHRGDNFSIPTDVWAIGNLFYQCLTGEHPFPYNSKDELPEIVKNPASYIALENRINERIPEKYIRVIKKCLSYDPQQRYGSVDEIIAALEPVSFFRRRRIPIGITVSAVILAGMIYLLQTSPDKTEEPIKEKIVVSVPKKRCNYRIEDEEEKYEVCTTLPAEKRSACITFREAESAMDNCRFEDALTMLEGLLIEDDTDIRYYGTLLETYVELKRFFEAGEVKEVIKTKFPDKKSREAEILAPWIVKTGITSKRLRSSLTERQCLIGFIREKYPECDEIVIADTLKGDAAIKAYEKIIQEHPNSYLAHLALSRTVFGKIKAQQKQGGFHYYENIDQINAALRHYDAVEQILEISGATTAEIGEQFAAQGDYPHAFLFSYRNWNTRFPANPVDSPTRHAALEIGKLSPQMSSIILSDGERIDVSSIACQQGRERCYNITLGALYAQVLNSCGNTENLFSIKNCISLE